MENSAIARIASPDLTSDALALLEAFGQIDDVVFFLGRLAWQGGMTGCANALSSIATDTSRGRYARVAAIRGTMSVGNEEQKGRVWQRIADGSGPLDHAVLAELLDWAEPSTGGVELLLRALEHVAHLARHSTLGLDQSLHAFIDRLPVMSDAAHDHPLGRLLVGLNEFLEREPFIERGDCHVSKQFTWLMPFATHVADRLVAARSAQALTPAAVAIMLNMPALRFWCPGDANEFRDRLSSNVPRWCNLNDLLYWTSIAEARARLTRSGQRLIDDWQVAFIGHFWGFGPEDFERCLKWVHTKEGDDRSVALSRSVRIYVEANRPTAWLAPLRAAVEGDGELEAMLEGRLNPAPPPIMAEMEADRSRWERQHQRRKRKEKKNRADWVRALKADPDRILHPAGLSPGEFSHDQCHLLTSIMDEGLPTRRHEGANWQALIPEFGEPVARAYRDAALAHWRAYRPGVRSEGADGGSIPYSLVFAMAGLAIEAGEDSAFAQRLTPEEARLAFRYAPWELNGFPVWFERLYRAFPEIGREVIARELTWELEQSGAGTPSHYILHDILYHAPWLHAEASQLVLEWLRAKDVLNQEGLRQCLNILTSGGIDSRTLAQLAAEKAGIEPLDEQRPLWFALWVDAEPSLAIPALRALLEGLPFDDATTFAQRFAVGLLGDRHGTGTRIHAYRNARCLKALYILMHRFIRIPDDTDRIGKGAFSPTLRDDAQRSRERLFNMLVEVPGPEAHAAIKSLENEHPEPGYRRWMAMRAHERAIMDADEPPWLLEQVRDFAAKIAKS